MRAFVVLAIVGCFALAGCSSKSSDPPAASTLPNGSVAPGGSSGPANQVPTAKLAATPMTGSTPLNVTFSAAGSDGDGDKLLATLSFGDGTASESLQALPAPVRHLYATAGNFTAQLTVSDGKASGTTKLVITVSKGKPLVPPQDVTGSWQASGPIACEQYTNSDDLQHQADQTKGIDWVPFDIRPDTVGKEFTFHATPTAPAALIELDFYAADGTQLAYFDSDATAWDLTGKVPKDSTTAAVFICSAAGGSFTYQGGL